MENCNDYWCENHGKNSSACDQCKEKSPDKEKPELRAILKRRAIDQMDIMESNKNKEQMR
ncbi:MAG: hypothetical protein LBD23_11000 [Oscillospiraceae bacterium]|jgi:hypothetical protein|nr:hypothetical protein [Oscillospiraceae bacterium]